MIKKVYFFCGLVFFIGGITVIRTERYDIKHGVYLELGQYSLIVGILIIFVGIYFIYLWKKYIKKIGYSKCKKCEEIYAYSTLEEGMCPRCNIKTIDMNKYYEL